MRLISNKKGDIQSIFYAIVIVAVIGIVLFMMSAVFYPIFEGIEEQLESDPQFNDTEATETISTIRNVEGGIWDYAFLAIAIGYVLLIAIFSFSQQTNPVFYWISVILSIIGLFIGVVLGTVWQGIAEEPSMADAVARFPITNTLLGSYYPVFTVFLILIGLVLLYGKSPGGVG